MLCLCNIDTSMAMVILKTRCSEPENVVESDPVNVCENEHAFECTFLRRVPSEKESITKREAREENLGPSRGKIADVVQNSSFDRKYEFACPNPPEMGPYLNPYVSIRMFCFS